MDNKKKDSDVIKVLECLHNLILRSKFAEEVTETEIMALVDAIDLINRQKEEIERYKGVIKILEKDVSNAKSEAITAYAEEVERRCIERGIYPVIVKNILHNVKEEMTQKPKGEDTNEKHQM